jgi:histidine triad (HIT) family protein
MFNHAPAGYLCPFCALARGGGDAVSDQEDIVFQDNRITAFIAARWWPNNLGHVIVIPNEHFEQLYDLPSEYGHAIHDVAREMALALKQVYTCDGISTRQHNEPAGGQDVWHYHLHVFPRYAGDDLYRSAPLPGFAPAAHRHAYAARLRSYLSAP